MHVFTFFFKVGSIGYSLGIVQWDFTRQDHPGNLGRVSGSGLINFYSPCNIYYTYVLISHTFICKSFDNFKVYNLICNISFET